MNPEQLGIVCSDISVVLKDQFTQISDSSINTTNSPTGISNNGSVLVFEFCPDRPNSLTAINYSESEEIINHPKNSSIEKSKTNRFKYSREVIKPILKRPDCTDSNDAILKQSLGFESEASQDCIPNLEALTGQTETNSANKVSYISIVDAVTSYLSMDKKNCESEDESKCPPDPAKSPEEAPKSPNSPKQKPPCGPPVHTPPKCEKKKKCKPKLKKGCSQENTSKCDEESEVVILTGTDDRSKDTENVDETQPNMPLPISRGSRSFINAHTEAIATIKVAMEDFLGKVYKTTQDAVTLIATESAKQIERIKASELANTLIHDRDTANNTTDTPLNVNFCSETDSLESDERQASHVQGPYAAEVIGSILTTVDSALAVLSANLVKSMENLQTSYSNQSSIYDIPKPLNVVNNLTPDDVPASNSVFSAIKSKICSMFSEADAKVVDVPLTKKSSKSSSSSFYEDESDINLGDRDG